VVRFEALYRTHCVGCHGGAGKLGPAPPLNDPLFRAIVPENELRRVLNEGRPGTPMAAFARKNGGPLTPTQVEILVHEIKGTRYRTEPSGKVAADPDGVAPTWGVPDKAPAGVPSYLTEGSGDGKKGADVFMRACATCHGPEGKGGRDAGAIHVPAFLRLISPQALRRVVITGRPDLKMPNYADKRDRGANFQPLTDAEVTDLVALLQEWRQERGGPPAP
jgi:mono/diheme cytochrome c family protein